MQKPIRAERIHEKMICEFDQYATSSATTTKKAAMVFMMALANIVYFICCHSFDVFDECAVNEWSSKHF